MPQTQCDVCGLPRAKIHDMNDVGLSSKRTDMIPSKQCKCCHQASYHGYNHHLFDHTTLFLVQESRNQKCLVAGRSLVPGQAITSTKSGESFFRPVVPPVLFTACRTSRCAVCFRDIQRPGITVSSESYYIVKLCSAACRLYSKEWLPHEVAVVRSVFQTAPQSAHLLPTALLVYRILQQTNAESWSELLAMQSHDRRNTGLPDHDEASLAHGHVVVFLLHHLIVRTEGLAAKIARSEVSSTGGIAGSRNYQSDDTGSSSLTEMFLNRIKYNAFTLTDTKKNSLGVGLYESPSYRINHSCDYNAVQSFTYDEATAPRLILHVCRSIPEGDEICISYIDTLDAPVKSRREILSKEYCFHCRCSRCEAEERSVQGSKEL